MAHASQNRSGARPAFDWRAHYDQRLKLARIARDQLRAELSKGVPPLMELPGGGTSGLAGLAHASVARLINAFVSANVRLHTAARMVVEREDLPNDGEEDGIRFEVTL